MFSSKLLRQAKTTQQRVSRVQFCEHMGVIALSAFLIVHRKYIVKGFNCLGLVISLHAMIQSMANIPSRDQ